MGSAFRWAPSDGRLGGAVVVALLLCTSTGHLQNLTEPSLKAAFIYNFAKFTEWPQDALPPTGTFIACVLGENPVQSALEGAVGGRQLSGRRISVVRVEIDGKLRACHLLYVSGVTTERMASIMETVRGAPVLTISDADDFARQGGIAQMYIESGKMRFELNLEVAKRCRLALSSKLLVLAARVYESPRTVSP